jgi:hypothetical protein
MAAGVNVIVIKRFEAGSDPRSSTRDRIERALLDSGVVLIDEGAGQPCWSGCGRQIGPSSQAPLNKRLFFVRRAAGRRIFRGVPRPTPSDMYGKRRGRTLLTAERRGATRKA